jgi:Carboxypeptidase regulatory-like domain/TonB dependent receptor/TonB-dependent Receptor Plug Domain
MPSKIFRVRVFVIFAVMLWTSVLAPGHSNAQVAGAMLKGTVTDPTGAYIPKAQVSIINVATGITRNVTTDATGDYAAANLRPGEYQIRVTATGFSVEVRSGITLTVGAQQVLDIEMHVGQMTQEIHVAGEAPTVELASSEISAEISSNTVRELPLNGRSWTDLATLQPGVTQINTQPSFTVGADRGNRGFGSQISVSGSRPQMDNYRLDGVTMNGYSNAAPGSVTGEKLGVDAVQEFSVITTNQGAEYGRTAGGVVNAVTKSGSNQFHGTGYEFLRNSALDAKNFFDDPANPIPPFRRNQFGASAGGPIIKEHTFFFADYEGVRQFQGHSILDTVFSNNARKGIVVDSKGNLLDQNGNITTTPLTSQAQCTAEPNGATNHLLAPGQAGFCVDDAAAKYLALYPLPNSGTETGNIGTYNFVQNQVVQEDFVTARVDHKFSDRDSLFGTLVWDRTPYSTPDGYNNVLLGDYTKDQMYILEWTHTFKPNFVNAARFGFNRQRADVDNSVSAINPAAANLLLGANSGRTAAQVNIPAEGIGLMTGGVGANPTYYYRWNSFQYYDDAFLTIGKHSIKFGGSVERMQTNATGLSNPNGVFNFGGIAQFLSNQPKSFNSGIESTLHSRSYRQTLFGLYFQDDWRIRPSFTVNIGLRYETVTVPTEVYGQLAVLYNVADPASHCGVPASGCSATGPLFQNPTHRDFQPRVGFAWDPFHDGKTAVRGGFGVFDNLPLMYEYTGMEILAAPFFELGSINSASALKGTFYSKASPLLGLSSFRGAYIENKMPRNYVLQWNLNIQRQITPSVTAFIGYVGSHGVHMPLRIDDYDTTVPTLTSAGYLYPKVDVLGNIYSSLCNQTNPNGADDPSCNPPSTLNPNFGSLRGMFYSGSSSFNALEAGVKKDLTHGFQLQGSFTWSKSIDDSSGTGYADQFSNSISSLAYFDNRLIRGVSDFNIGRTLVINGIWRIPTGGSLTGISGAVANGWQVQSIFKMNDGIPFSATYGTGGDPQGLLNSDDWAYPNRLGGPGCNSLVNPGNPNQYVKTQCFSVPTAPNMAFWTANCDPAPPSVGGPLAAGDLSCYNLRGNSGRNILTAPGLINLDFAVFKNNYIHRISETFNVQFRAEMFNLLNRANFAPPVLPNQSDIFNADGSQNTTAGQLKSTITDAREVQFGLKIIW